MNSSRFHRQDRAEDHLLRAFEVNIALIMAGGLTILMGLVHSIYGEIKVLPGIESKRGIASEPLLSRWQMQVLRGTWHSLSLFGFGLGFVLFTLGWPLLAAKLGVKSAIAISCLAVAVFWAIVTRFWHPAWVTFALVSALCFWA